MTTLDRTLSACGPLAVALMLAGNGIVGGTPGLGAPRAELDTFLRELEPAWAGAGLEALGLLALLAFAVGLARRAGGTLGTLVVAAASAAVAVKLATALPLATVWLRADTIDPQTAGLALDAGMLGFVLTGALLALVSGAVAASAILPRWLAVLGGVTSLALLSQLLLFRQEFGLGFLLFMIWTLAAGTVLLRGGEVERRAAPQPA